MRPLPGRYLRGGTGVRPFECEGFGNEVEGRPDAHNSVTNQGQPQPRPNGGSRPRRNERGDHAKLEKRVNRYPESPARDPASLRLNEIQTLGPEGIDNQKFVETASDQHERKAGSSGREGERKRHQKATSNGRR